MVALTWVRQDYELFKITGHGLSKQLQSINYKKLKGVVGIGTITQSCRDKSTIRV